jgi:hypothetical protein
VAQHDPDGLPDGDDPPGRADRALSFLDSTTTSVSPTSGQARISPALAIELDPTLS